VGLPPDEYYRRHTESRATRSEFERWFLVADDDGDGDEGGSNNDDKGDDECNNQQQQFEQRIWIRAHDVPTFARYVVPRLNERRRRRAARDDSVNQIIRPPPAASIVLITSDGDRDAPGSYPVEVTAAILNSPSIAAWYAQNYDGTVRHPKLYPIPIGFDLHTRWSGLVYGNNSNGEADGNDDDKDLEFNLQNIMLPLRNRGLNKARNFSNDVVPAPGGTTEGAAVADPWLYVPPMALAPWSHWHRRRAVTTVVGCLPEEGLVRVAQSPWSMYAVLGRGPKLPVTALWDEYAKYRFVLSPRGVGLDCHRTWEILFFGGIPVVETSSLDPLFEGLPVLVVDKYSDICRDPEHFFETAYNRLQSTLPVPDEVFTMEWWLTRHHGNGGRSRL